jgi:pimeloyl-ACP methyl ester carboxylesterase
VRTLARANRDISRPSPSATATTLPGRTLAVGEVNMRVLDEGEGSPVLLLHGFPDRADEWRYVGARLRAAGRRTIAPDLRGFGESSAPVGRRAYHLDRVLEDLLGLLDALGIEEPIDLIGHDWGALTSWMLCLEHPDRVRRHVALSSGHPNAYLRAGFEQKRRGLYVLLWQVPHITEQLLSADDFRRFRALVSSHPDLDQAIADLSRPGRLTAGLNWYRANLFDAVRRHRPPCRVATLGAWSSGDKYLVEDQMFHSGEYMDAPWRFVRLDGPGHWLPLEAPDAVADLAIAWFEGSKNGL